MRRNHIKSLSGRSQGGFTLIELMIVVAVVAILAAIGIPSYRQHAMKSNRAAAEAFLQQLSNRQEQYVLNARIYASSVTSLKLAVPDDVSTKYQINIALPTTATPNTYYTLTAVPIGGQVNDKVCGVVALDQTGQKGAKCTVDGSGNVALNTGTTPPTMQCDFAQASVCW